MFYLNPYDADLDLSDKEDRRLFLEACKGLPDFEFGGERNKISEFLKLLEVEMSDKRLLKTLDISMEWKGTCRNPTKIQNLLENDNIKMSEVESHMTLIWSESDYEIADTSKFFRNFTVDPSSLVELEKIRNKQRLKHVILGKKVWNTLSSAYKVELSADSADWTKKNNTDGVLLLTHILKDVKPSTTVGLNNLKDELESKKLTDFEGESVKVYNKWFSGKRDEIRKAEGGSSYNEYIRNIFKAYLSASNADFKMSINDEKRKWVTGRLDASYEWTDLRNFALVSYNNLEASGEWGPTTSRVPDKENQDPMEGKFLAFLTKVLGDKAPTHNNVVKTPGTEAPPRGWKLLNKTGAKTCKMPNYKGVLREWYWCHSDCHDQPCWCPRKKCRNKAEYAKFMEDRKQNGQSGPSQTAQGSGGDLKSNEDFRIALSAMISDENMKALEEQFLKN